MGVTESKILAEKVLKACEAAEAGGITKLNASFWNDKEVSRAAKSVFKQVPSNIRGPSRQNAADRAAARSKTKIVVPDAVKKLQGQNERSFLPVAQSQNAHNYMSNTLPQARQPPEQFSLAGFYVLVTDIETNKEICNIRLRLFYVLFNRLKQKIQPRGFWTDAVTYLAQIIYSSGLVNDSMQVIQGKVTTWVERGSRYELLANDLGGLGSLLVLPDDVPESVWAKDLPKAAGNSRRIAMIDSLKQRGILEAIDGMNEVAEAQINELWVPIYASIDAESQRLSQMHILDEERSLVAADNHSDTLPQQLQCENIGQRYRPNSAQHDLLSFSMVPDPTIADNAFLSPPMNNQHDLSSFSMVPDPAIADNAFLSHPSNNQHDLLSFSMVPDPTIANNAFLSPPMNNQHDLSSFSMVPDPAIADNAFLSHPRNNQHDLSSFSMVPDPTTADNAFLSPPTNNQHDLSSFSIVSDPTIADNVSRPPPRNAQSLSCSSIIPRSTPEGTLPPSRTQSQAFPPISGSHIGFYVPARFPQNSVPAIA